MQSDGVVVAQQFKRAQHQFTKIHHAFALALVFVELINVNFTARFVVAHIDIFGPQAVFLATGNEPL